MASEKKYYGLREIRDMISFSLEEFAFFTGITTGHLNNIEKNKRPMTIETAEKIAVALVHLLKSVDEGGEDLRSLDFGGNGERRNSGDPNYWFNESIKIRKIDAELLLANHNASFHDLELQEEVFRILVNIAKNKYYLRYVEEKGEKASDEYVEELEKKMSLNIKEMLINYIHEDYCWEELENIKDDLRKKLALTKRGYFATLESSEEERDS